MDEITYAQAGVNRKTSEQAKGSIKEIVAQSHTKNVLKGIGLFSGFYALDASKFTEPVLVSSIDGVGTKVKIAQMMGVFDSIGEDLVNHCVNDIMVCGADPLLFMDYIAADRLHVSQVAAMVGGMSRACQAAGCALIGGETAEMPDVYLKDHFDLAGCIVGVVEKKEIIDGSRIEENDLVVGVASNGLHTNGFSLVRHILFEKRAYDVTSRFEVLDKSLGKELLRTHCSYADLIKKVRLFDEMHGIVHVTGGGLIENASRLLRSGLAVEVDWSMWRVPPIFGLLQAEGNISDAEMRNVFNMGIGLALVVEPKRVDRILELCESQKQEAWVIGKVVASSQ